MYKIKEPQPIAPVESTCAPETQGGASRAPWEGTRGSPSLPGASVPQVILFSHCLCRRPQAWEPQATCAVLPSSGMSPREGWSSTSQTPCPMSVPSPCGGPPLRHPLFLLKGTDCNPGASTRAPHTPNSGFPQRPGIDRATGHGQGPGLGDMAAGCQGAPPSNPVAKVEPNLGPCPCTLCPALPHGCRRG